MKVAITKNAKILALFAIACTAVVGLVNEATKGRIKKQEQAQLIATLSQIVPQQSYDNEMSGLCIPVASEQLGSSEIQKAYLATLNDQPSAIAITSVAPNGYNGNIHLISAYTMEGELTGVRVLKHKETPGLGDKIEIRKSDWVLSLAKRSLAQINSPQWQVKKDGGIIDQFTGATITPRAVVKAVQTTANYVNEHKYALFEQAKNQIDTPDSNPASSCE